MNDISIEDILIDMYEHETYYNFIFNPPENRVNYYDVLRRINRLEVKSCVPFLMDLFKAHSDQLLTDEELYHSFIIIENYIVRREICELPSNVFNKLFVIFGAEINKDIKRTGISYYEAFKYEITKRTGKSRFPNDSDFSEKFITYEIYNSKPSMKKYILERLENYNNKDLIDVEKLIDCGRLTIEHIMPQTLTEEWKMMLGNNWELIHSKYKDMIGNITLTAYNSDYSNSSFNVKKTMKK